MKNNNKQIMYSIIGIAILIISVVGVTYSFFNFMFSFILCSVLISNPNKIRELEEKN